MPKLSIQWRKTEAPTQRHTLYLLTGLFACLWLALAITPIERSTWLLENILVVIGLGLLWWLARVTPFSNASLGCIFVFLALHTIGAHFTYSMVPYDAAWAALGGNSINTWLDAQRNHYDRLVHFAFGVLMTLPLRELLIHQIGVRGFWSWFLPFNLTLSSSLAYELIEWGAAEVFAGSLGAAFLGTQGDEWDAQRDMALAGLGALLAIGILYARNALRRHPSAQGA